ncbi:hypothetical protein D9M70_440610 [compost metagenome]
MVGGLICDLSIFWEAHTSKQSDSLRVFKKQHFGVGKSVLILAPDRLPARMEYVPQFALNEAQVFEAVARL